MDYIAEAHRKLLALGASVEDARDLLPMGILTNIVMKAHLRTIASFMQTRTNPRNAGEIVHVVHAMRAAIVDVHPWATIFLDRTMDVVSREMYEAIEENVEDRLARTSMVKLVDQLLMEPIVVGEAAE
jgi:thymidylate synthase ThyX